MGVHDRVSRSRVGSAHFVQFFDSDDTRQEAVAGFLRNGYLSGSSLIIVARPVVSRAILDRLQLGAAPIARDLRSGRITALDAVETLRRISRSGSPDARLFEEIVGSLVTRLSRQGAVHAYGEMVDLLAQRGDFADALLLDDLWNRLLERASISLLCGYAAAHFVAPGSRDALRDICAAHSAVRVDPQDPLAAWLLSQAQAQ
jgi:DcmR-like sensory protein